MTDLSPAAQQVFWEFNRAASGKPDDWHYLPAIAAALRAAAFHLSFGHATGSGILCEDDLYAIAAELEACCEWFVRDWTDIETANKLRAARRPKPPSLKEQALKALRRIERGQDRPEDTEAIRRALESLPS